MTEHDLPPQHKNLWLKGVSAYQLKNYDYAINLILTVVKSSPEFLDGRRLLRRAEGEKFKSQKKGLMSKMPAFSIKMTSGAKKEPWDGIAELEETVFQKDPYNLNGNQSLYEFATRMAQPELAAFALETIRDGHPENTRNLHKLAEHYMAYDQPEKAGDVYRQIARVDPRDMDAIKGEKDAAAKTSMLRQWQSDLHGVKDPSQKEKDENLNRQGMTREQMESLLAQLATDYQQDPNDLNVVKRIADLYDRMEEHETALGYYEWACHLSPADVALQSRVQQVKDKVDDLRIERMEAEIESDAAAPDIDEKRAQVRAIKQDRLATRIADARTKVERNPTDKQYRFDLAAVLYMAEQYREAIPELQQAKSNPHIRNRAILTLGKCFAKLNMNDLAVNAFNEAVKEIVGFNAEKKELLYELGVIYQKMGKQEEYLHCMKEIYNSDYGYKDVATRVESSYA